MEIKFQQSVELCFLSLPFSLLNMEKSDPIAWGAWWHTKNRLDSKEGWGESLAKSCGRGRVHPWALLLPSQSLPTLCLIDFLWAPLICSFTSMPSHVHKAKIQSLQLSVQDSPSTLWLSFQLNHQLQKPMKFPTKKGGLFNKNKN